MLFKLKPSLITSFSQDKFRIVIENYTGISLSDEPIKQANEEGKAGTKVSGTPD